MAVIQKYGKKHSPDMVCHKESHPSDKVGAPGCQKKWNEHNNTWSRPEARVWTVVLLLGTCLLYCARVAMPICAFSMAEQFNWTKRESGMVLGSFFWGYCFTQVFGGYVSDRVGGEKVLLLSAAAWGSMTAFTPILAHFCSQPILSMTLARFLMGLLQGVHYPSLASLCSQKVVESERGFLMSTVGSGSYLGTLVIGGAGSFMLDLYGWQSVFYVSGLLSVLWAYCMWKYLLKGEGPIITLESLGGSQSKLSKRHWLRLLKQPAVCAVIVTHLCTASTFFTLLSWLPTFFKDTFPDAKGWVFNVIPWLVAIPSSLFSGCLSDHLISQGYDTASVRKLMQFFSMGVSSVFTLLLCGNNTFPWAVAFVSATMGFTTFSHRGPTGVFLGVSHRDHRLLDVCVCPHHHSQPAGPLHLPGLRRGPPARHRPEQGPPPQHPHLDPEGPACYPPSKGDTTLWQPAAWALSENYFDRLCVWLMKYRKSY
ncbi:voltage-gated purine nucleotide uniporter SLC17A9-like isoform X1 [Anarhichas minor]|uniref:voltage-gated purine nucleotide uniporter SLC17A9-like isoform X1 n=1 Tax=Anarhichas minor TaxID=65739 RepID=UPI003F739913